MLFNKNTCSCF
ncbi:hypothetical protein ERK19_05035 [Lactobacillus helsingborgensis]|nr:hypothetical protein [Lactobacillus helsingborgensis]